MYVFHHRLCYILLGIYSDHVVDSFYYVPAYEYKVRLLIGMTVASCCSSTNETHWLIECIEHYKTTN